ncbi:hypothetical protein [Moraxella lacunata]|uniref:hypothetical protein n=1 Tax=Moraxella lacunata TaxID=477 RepID=UPI003EE10844
MAVIAIHDKMISKGVINFMIGNFLIYPKLAKQFCQGWACLFKRIFSLQKLS